MPSYNLYKDSSDSLVLIESSVPMMNKIYKFMRSGYTFQAPNCLASSLLEKCWRTHWPINDSIIFDKVGVGVGVGEIGRMSVEITLAWHIFRIGTTFARFHTECTSPSLIDTLNIDLTYWFSEEHWELFQEPIRQLVWSTWFARIDSTQFWFNFKKINYLFKWACVTNVRNQISVEWLQIGWHSLHAVVNIIS